MSSLRMPQGLSRRVDDGEAVLLCELLEEQAVSLGRAGRKVQDVVAKLRAHGGGDDARRELLRQANDAVWCFFAQREAMGMRDRAAVVAQFDVPREVVVRLGAR